MWSNGNELIRVDLALAHVLPAYVVLLLAIAAPDLISALRQTAYSIMDLLATQTLRHLARAHLQSQDPSLAQSYMVELEFTIAL